MTPRADVENAPSAKKALAEAGLLRRCRQGHGPRRSRHEGRRRQGRGHTAPAAAAAPASVPRAPIPAEDAAREERVKMTLLRATIARRLKDAQTPPRC